MSGTVPVHYGRASDWSRVINFGDPAFNTDNTIRVNGIDYTIAGLTVVETGTTWRRVSGMFLRRCGELSTGTPAAHHAVAEWAIGVAGELADEYPEVFDDIACVPRHDGFESAAEQFERDAWICRRFAALHDHLEACTVREVTDVGELYWQTPQSTRSYGTLGEGRQPARAVAEIQRGSKVVGYVVAARTHGPVNPRGGLCVPIELTSTERRRV